MYPVKFEPSPVNEPVNEPEKSNGFETVSSIRSCSTVAKVPAESISNTTRVPSVLGNISDQFRVMYNHFFVPFLLYKYKLFFIY